MTPTKRRGSRVKKSAKKGSRVKKPKRAAAAESAPKPLPEAAPEPIPVPPPEAPPLAVRAIEKWLQDVPEAAKLPFSDHLRLLTNVTNAIVQGQAGGRWFKRSQEGREQKTYKKKMKVTGLDGDGNVQIFFQQAPDDPSKGTIFVERQHTLEA